MEISVCGLANDSFRMFKFDLLPSTVYSMKLLWAKKEKNGGKLSKVSGIRCTARLFFCSLCCIQLFSWEQFHMKCLYEVNRSQNQSELQIETVKPETGLRMWGRIQQSEYWQLAWRVVRGRELWCHYIQTEGTSDWVYLQRPWEQTENISCIMSVTRLTELDRPSLSITVQWRGRERGDGGCDSDCGSPGMCVPTADWWLVQRADCIRQLMVRQSG